MGRELGPKPGTCHSCWLFRLICLALVAPRSCHSFSFQRQLPSAYPSRLGNVDVTASGSKVPLRLSAQDYSETENKPEASATSASSWAKHALLISSFSDGILASPDAQSFLKYSLACSLTSEHVRLSEKLVRDSVMASPCNGPDMDALNSLETFDQISQDGNGDSDKNDYEQSADRILQSLASEQARQDTDVITPITIRLLYIPTAMYALNPESSNTTGKQRQRARADGKKRRNQVAQHLEDLIQSYSPDVNVLAITMDLDDGSLKQPAGSDQASIFPSNGVEALTTWEPHVICVEGGNTFWLQHCLEKGGWGEHIQSACVGEDAKSIYIGKSAGAIIAGTLVETASWKGWDDPSVVPSKETNDDWKGHPGLSMVGNLSFFPHMNDDWKPLVEEKQKDLEIEKNPNTIVCLGEFDAGCVDGRSKTITVVSGDDTSQA